MKISTDYIINFVFGTIVSVFIAFPVFFVSVYTNPKTYHGNEGHNNPLIVLIAIVIVGVITLFSKRVRQNKIRRKAYSHVLILIISLLGIAAILE